MKNAAKAARELTEKEKVRPAARPAGPQKRSTKTSRSYPLPALDTAPATEAAHNPSQLGPRKCRISLRRRSAIVLAQLYRLPPSRRRRSLTLDVDAFVFALAVTLGCGEPGWSYVGS